MLKPNRYHLPAEIWTEVFQHLGVQDLRSVQLVSRCFAEESWKSLQKFPFIVCRQKPDLQKLANLAASRISSKIRVLRFSLDYPEQDSRQQITWDAKKRFNFPFQFPHEKYCIRYRLSAARSYVERNHLASTFAMLKNVSCLVIFSKTDGRKADDPVRCVHEYGGLINAAQHLDSLKKLHLCVIPFEFFHAFFSCKIVWKI